MHAGNPNYSLTCCVLVVQARQDIEVKTVTKLGKAPLLLDVVTDIPFSELLLQAGKRCAASTIVVDIAHAGYLQCALPESGIPCMLILSYYPAVPGSAHAKGGSAWQMMCIGARTVVQLHALSAGAFLSTNLRPICQRVCMQLYAPSQL